MGMASFPKEPGIRPAAPSNGAESLKRDERSPLAIKLDEATSGLLRNQSNLAHLLHAFVHFKHQAAVLTLQQQLLSAVRQHLFHSTGQKEAIARLLSGTLQAALPQRIIEDKERNSTVLHVEETNQTDPDNRRQDKQDDDEQKDKDNEDPSSS